MFPTLRLIIGTIIVTIAFVMVIGSGLVAVRAPYQSFGDIPDVSRQLVQSAITRRPDGPQSQIMAYARRSDELHKLLDLPISPGLGMAEAVTETQNGLTAEPIAAVADPTPPTPQQAPVRSEPAKDVDAETTAQSFEPAPPKRSKTRPAKAAPERTAIATLAAPAIPEAVAAPATPAALAAASSEPLDIAPPQQQQQKPKLAALAEPAKAEPTPTEPAGTAARPREIAEPAAPVAAVDTSSADIAEPQDLQKAVAALPHPSEPEAAPSVAAAPEPAATDSTGSVQLAHLPPNADAAEADAKPKKVEKAAAPPHRHAVRGRALHRIRHAVVIQSSGTNSGPEQTRTNNAVFFDRLNGNQQRSGPAANPFDFKGPDRQSSSP